MDALCVDGSLLEGGGQVVRVATALSCISGNHFTIKNVRGNRKQPGLRPQHLTGLQLVTRVCNGRADGLTPGSTEFEIFPGTLAGGSYEADTKTAGSVCLLMQVSLPCLLFASGPSHVTFCGGTNADFAPPIDYYTQVFLPSVKLFGMDCKMELKQRGFFPRGGGKVVADVLPVKHLTGVDITSFGQVKHISGLVYIAGKLSETSADAMSSAACAVLKRNFNDVDISCDVIREDQQHAVGSGLGIFLKAETTTGCLLGSSGIPKKGVDPRVTGQEAANELVGQLNKKVCVDQHLQDQLILFMALARGSSAIRAGDLTLHTKTAISVAEQALPVKFNIHSNDDATTTISCDGIGFVNRQMEQLD